MIRLPAPSARQLVRWLASFSFALVIGPAADAATIYSGQKDLAIPTDFTGVYLDLETGTTSAAEFAGWDVNPFFGGAAIANSPTFQPVRIGPTSLARVLNLAPGTVVSSSLTYATGFGGSGQPGSEHLGLAADQFQPGTEGFLGFQLTTASGPRSGWLRVTLTANAPGALVHDWAYDDAGAAITVGRIRQSAPSGGTQLVTLSPQTGEVFTLGSALSDTAGNINSVLKSGAGTTTLAATNSHTGSTTVTAGTLRVTGDLAATSSVSVTAGTLLLAGTSEAVNDAASLQLGAAGRVAFDPALSGRTETFASLELLGAAILDFGEGTANRFAFTAGIVGLAAATLSIHHWSGSIGTASQDILAIGSALSAVELGNIRFYADAGTTLLGTGEQIAFGSPELQIVPVPEPSTLFTSLALLGLAGWRRIHADRRARSLATS